MKQNENGDEVLCEKLATGTVPGDGHGSRKTHETEQGNLSYRGAEPNVTDTDVSDTLQCRKAEDMETAILIGASNTKNSALNGDSLENNIYACSKGDTRLKKVISSGNSAILNQKMYLWLWSTSPPVIASCDQMDQQHLQSTSIQHIPSSSMQSVHN